MKKALTIFNGFVHDFAAGCWVATLLAVWWLERAAASEPTAAAVLSDLQRQFVWIGVGCTVLVLATGAGRGFSYVADFYGEEAETQRRKMLILKHILLFAVFGCGIGWQVRTAFR